MSRGLTIGFGQVPLTLPAARGLITVEGPDARFSANASGTVATPSISPATGTYVGTQTCIITCSTAGSAIYYTTDGSVPTFPITGTTQLYTGSFSVSSSEVVSAIGQAATLLNSSVASVSYTITGSGATFDFYVSPTGSDTNAGTVLSPWAVTSLSHVTFNANNVANWNQIVGKRVGLMPGYYDMSGLMQVGSSKESDGATYLPAGSSLSAISYWASCDAAGHYSPPSNWAGNYSTSAPVAWLDAKGATNLYGGAVGATASTHNGSIISHVLAAAGGVGFATVDSIRFSGWSYKAVRFGGNSSGDGAVITNPVLIQNCEFFGGGFNQSGMIMSGTIVGGSGYANGVYFNVPLTGGAGSAGTAIITVAGGAVTTVQILNASSGYGSGNVLSASNVNLGGSGSGFTFTLTAVGASGDQTDNCCAMWADRQLNCMTITNNWFHDSTGHAVGSGDHFNAILTWGTAGSLNNLGIVITNNTSVRAGAFLGKEGGIGGPTLTGNYIDISNLTTAIGGAIQDWTGNSDGSPASTLTVTIAFNICLVAGGNTAGSFDSLGGVSTDSQNTLAWRSPAKIYNNLVVNRSTTGGAIVGELHCNAGENGVRAIQYFNNIYYNPGGGTSTTNGNGNFRANPQSLASMDYNLVPASGVTWALSSNSAPGTTVNTANSIAQWQTNYAAAGGGVVPEAHSIAGTPNFTGSGLYAQQFQLQSGSLGKGTGSVDGTTGGAATDMGPFGNGNTQVGCTFAVGS